MFKGHVSVKNTAGDLAVDEGESVKMTSTRL